MKHSFHHILATIVTILTVLLTVAIAGCVVYFALHKFPVFTVIVCVIVTIFNVANLVLKLFIWLLEKSNKKNKIS